jgi:hypothetical protein
MPSNNSYAALFMDAVEKVLTEHQSEILDQYLDVSGVEFSRMTNQSLIVTLRRQRRIRITLRAVVESE